MPRLILLRPGRSPKAYPLSKPVLTIGSAKMNDIALDDPGLGPVHAQLSFDGKDARLVVADPTLRLVVNSRPCKRRHLAHGDRIRLGTSEFEFVSTDDPRPSDHAAPQPECGAMLATLLALSRRLDRPHTLAEIFEALCDSAIHLGGADTAFLILLDQGTPRIHTARNLHAEELGDPGALLSDSLIARVAKTREPVLLGKTIPEAEYAAASPISQKLRLGAVACFPLLEHGELLGVLHLGRYDAARVFLAEELSAVPVLATEAALLVRLAILGGKQRLERTAASERETYRFGQLVGRCEAMRRVFGIIERVAASEVDVAITGETGTGKELVAREIHRRSSRAKGPFVAVNCGAIPDHLLESELFGHARGAFTGALTRKDGHFHAAHGGTLFLDEIGELPLGLQVKLLRAIAERTVVRVGEVKPEPVSVRIISATHRDLQAEMKAGRFREDLYWRVCVVQLPLPPLRERGEDILLVATELLGRIAKEYGAPVPGFSPRAVGEMKRYGWPGNIRQLENHLRTALILSDKAVLGPEDLGLGKAERAPILPLDEAQKRFSAAYIREAVECYAGNRHAAAQALGVDPRTVFRYLERPQPERKMHRK